ncbi:hypothetical protein B0H15DRAFT_957881 [Mycena belliarum]|uniref:Uncharacterized protein n=1 Tax=Mycena belliarum TaxID=1033014 RepID=A0AAD6XG72_9AGAR|nr:hypothetical protein B0H15DRAFT_957881 [Mycena belliae]
MYKRCRALVAVSVPRLRRSSPVPRPAHPALSPRPRASSSSPQAQDHFVPVLAPRQAARRAQRRLTPVSVASPSVAPAPFVPLAPSPQPAPPVPPNPRAPRASSLRDCLRVGAIRMGRPREAGLSRDLDAPWVSIRRLARRQAHMCMSAGVPLSYLLERVREFQTCGEPKDGSLGVPYLNPRRLDLPRILGFAPSPALILPSDALQGSANYHRASSSTGLQHGDDQQRELTPNRGPIRSTRPIDRLFRDYLDCCVDAIGLPAITHCRAPEMPIAQHLVHSTRAVSLILSAHPPAARTSPMLQSGRSALSLPGAAFSNTTRSIHHAFKPSAPIDGFATILPRAPAAMNHKVEIANPKVRKLCRRLTVRVVRLLTSIAFGMTWSQSSAYGADIHGAFAAASPRVYAVRDSSPLNHLPNCIHDKPAGHGSPFFSALRGWCSSSFACILAQILASERTDCIRDTAAPELSTFFRRCAADTGVVPPSFPIFVLIDILPYLLHHPAYRVKPLVHGAPHPSSKRRPRLLFSDLYACGFRRGSEAKSVRRYAFRGENLPALRG